MMTPETGVDPLCGPLVLRSEGIEVTFDPLVVDTVPSDAKVGWYGRLFKRAIDIVVATVLLCLLSPLVLAVWLVLRISLGRAVVLRQPRVGRFGKTFGCLKFRTMHLDRRRASTAFEGVDRRRNHKSPDDPRHTRLGRLLRKYSLDELPQLWNVLRGDMSLVGPRPEMATVADASFRNHCRHDVRPGLTGPFQLSEHRGGGRLVDGLTLDEQYLGEVSFASDVRYVGRTAWAIVRGTGA